MRTVLVMIGMLGSMAAGCDGDSSTSTTTSSASCCQGDSYYTCPSSDDASACFSGQPNACSRDTSGDEGCSSSGLTEGDAGADG